MKWSKTEAVCDCPVLQRAADDPEHPVRFDLRLNAFNLVYRTARGGEARMRIYHCPFCGGRTPHSRRASLFARIPDTEQNRLLQLTAPLRRLDEVLALFGPPDWDFPYGVGEETPERDGNPPVVRAFRRLDYTGLSEVADVQVVVYPDDRVGISLRGKYLGNPDGEPGLDRSPA